MAMAKRRSPPKDRVRRLILVRHAHRDKDHGARVDNGLSKKGRRQARALADALASRGLPAGVRLLSSPLKRCVETAEAIAAGAGGCVEPSLLLMEEGLPGSPTASMSDRIERFCSDWRGSGDEVLVAVGHGDWLPRCIKLLTGARIELKKGAWAEITLEHGAPRLAWLVQDSAAVRGER